jgi:hypothetical protein
MAVMGALRPLNPREAHSGVSRIRDMVCNPLDPCTKYPIPASRAAYLFMWKQRCTCHLTQWRQFQTGCCKLLHSTCFDICLCSLRRCFMCSHTTAQVTNVSPDVCCKIVEVHTTAVHSSDSMDYRDACRAVQRQFSRFDKLDRDRPVTTSGGGGLLWWHVACPKPVKKMLKSYFVDFISYDLGLLHNVFFFAAR